MYNYSENAQNKRMNLLEKKNYEAIGPYRFLNQKKVVNFNGVCNQIYI